MADVSSIISGAVSGTVDLVNSIYNIYNQNRNYELQQQNYDYQKSLQQQIFQREDTAVERRMADLEKSGLNPQLAAGNGASSGAIVSTKAPQRENINPLGSALDLASHVEQLRQQKIQTENLKKQGKLIDKQSDKATYDAAAAEYNAQYLANENDYLFGEHWTMDNSGNLASRESGKFWDLMDFQYANKKNSADIIQKQNDWYTTNQIMNFVGNAIGDVSDIAGSFNKASGGLRYIRGNLGNRR